MTLMPEDIQSKQFHVRFRGFDVEEVDGFLEQVAENFLMLLEENRTLRTKIEGMTQEIELFRQDESSFKNAIVSAQKVGDEMKRKSRNEANRLMAQVTAEVTQLRDEANKEVAQLEAKVDQLKGMQTKIMGDLRGVLNSYLEQLDDSSLNVTTVDSREAAPVGKVATPVSKSVDAGPSMLYEKITVDDDDEPWSVQAEEESLSLSEEAVVRGARFSGPTVGGLDFEDEPSVSIPEMDDEVMFTLEDPLDQDGVTRTRR
ncbi:MAG: DivIVA domain-containing protein [Desulfobulbaceae bacterium]|nr:DivIVA domain-containing protein [Desulfobulbaceae bacterium]